MLNRKSHKAYFKIIWVPFHSIFHRLLRKGYVLNFIVWIPAMLCFQGFQGTYVGNN